MATRIFELGALVLIAAHTANILMVVRITAMTEPLRIGDSTSSLGMELGCTWTRF